MKRAQTKNKNKISEKVKKKRSGKKILIVSADYYREILEELTKGAVEKIKSSGYDFDIISVPGAFEIPAVINFAAQKNAYSGFVALGCVIRGETSHYDYVCGESARALMDLTVNKKLCIGFGILTVENENQAWERAGRKKLNKGAEVANACIEMIEIKKKYSD